MIGDFRSGSPSRRLVTPNCSAIYRLVQDGVQPLIVRDAVFWFYRTQPALAVAAFRALPRGHITGPVRRYAPSADGGGNIPTDADQLFVTVFAVSSATLSIDSTAESIVPGINQFAVPVAAGPAPAFRLSRRHAI